MFTILIVQYINIVPVSSRYNYELFRQEDSATNFIMNDELGKRIQAVRPLLKDADAAVRTAAAQAIETLEGCRTVDELLETLRSGDLGARVAAIHALGEIGGEKVLAPLIYCVRRPEDDIRSAAVAALGKLAQPAALQPVVECLDDRSPAIQARAIAALAAFPTSAALLSRLRPFLDATDGVLEAEAALTLARHKDLFSLDRITELLMSPHAATRMAAAQALSLLPLQ